MHKFKIGDSVTLKSSDLNMTVEGIRLYKNSFGEVYNIYKCMWMRSDGATNRSEFEEKFLKKAPTP